MSIYKDVDLRMLPHPMTKDVLVRTDARAVMQSIRELAMTTAGEWDNERNMGAGANRLLGENADPMMMASLKAAIEDNVKRFEPRADLKTVNAVQLVDNLNAVKISVEFYTLNIPELQIAEIPLIRLR
ncbi:baseplate wedge subunit [Vibrio phage K469]